MRDVPAIWEAWRSGIYVGDTKPSTRVTVEETWYLRPTDPVLGQWDRGPARWFQRADTTDQVETEVPGVTSVHINRSTEPDAGTCDIVVRNVTPPVLGGIETPVGQLADIGYYTPERGESQDANARWGHAINPWNHVLAPNALIRTYQGFGGQDKTIGDAVTDGNLVLNGVWLVDDVTINTDGTINIKCRDMAKLLIDQLLLPPLVPAELYPLLYQRYRIETYAIPADPPPGIDFQCPDAVYDTKLDGWSSSTDETYGAFNATNTGHPPTDAFDISPEPGPDTPGSYAHQRTYWLSEPKGAASDSVWIEFGVRGGLAGIVNQIYYHAWKGAIEGRGCHLVMVSVFENGEWVPGETSQGGTTPQGLPYVCTFVPGTEPNPAQATNLYALPRDYNATRIRLTVTNLILADDFPYGFGDPDVHGGGYRGGARKIMACFSQSHAIYPSLVFAGAGIPVNVDNRYGYWQVRSNGRVFAFGDARVYPPNNDPPTHFATVVGMSAHPSGAGYWTIDTAGHVVAAGQADWHGDLYADRLIASLAPRDDIVDIAPTPDGNGYWILCKNGDVFPYGTATNEGSSAHSGTLPSGAPAVARSIESHPTTSGYWVLWTDGHVDAFNLTDYGSADRDGFYPLEYVTAIRRTSTGAGYWIVSGRGIVQAKGDATWHGNGTGGAYDTDQWPYQLCWDLIPSSSSDAGYFIQRANGSFVGGGDFHDFGSVGSGQGQLRYDGNYKDYCLDAETEILTRRGWLRHDEVQVGDDAWSLDSATGVGRWSKVEKVHQYEHDGEVLRMNGRFIDATSTPNHRWIASVRWQHGHRFVTSRNLRQTHDIPLRPDSVEAPDPIVDDEFVDLIAWFWTEGCIDRNRLCIAQSEEANPGHVDRIDKTLRHLYGDPGPLRQGHLWNRSVRSNRVVSFRLSTTLTASILEAAPEKLPTIEWLTSLSAAQRKQFVLTSLDADGHRRASSWVLTQADERRARRFEVACLLAGYGVSSRQYVPGSWSVTVLRRTKAKPVTTRRLADEQTRWEHHRGVMWCPTTETGTWLARRNGRCYFTGNSDIIRDLLLWAGFYLYKNPQPESERPDVYGNIESTGAWSTNDPLPQEMFDKRPVMDAIRDIKAIVGYVFFIDAEGGARFEAPNWWQMGNFLIDGTPYAYMPEVDEKVQLTSHSVVRSAAAARSEIIIATEYPYSSVNGQKAPESIVKTRIPGSAVGDLRGIIAPFIWNNGELLRADEQRVMAELVDMQIWFQRRTASVQCVANPLIDVNDQVRIIERQTGDVYVHYIKAIEFSHDIQSGQFTMSLTTHWLGGTPYGQLRLFFACAERPQGDGYWQIAANGDIFAYGSAELHERNDDDTHLSWPIAMRPTPSGDGYWTLDQNGKVLSYGDALSYGSLNRQAKDAIDLAVTPTGNGYWILLLDGTVHTFGDAVFYGNANIISALPNGAINEARSIESHPTTMGYWILQADGTVQGFNLSAHGSANRVGFRPDEYTTRIRRTVTGAGYWVSSGSGLMQNFGDATDHGSGIPYGDDKWNLGLVWDFLTHPDGSYAIQHADGNIETFDFPDLGVARVGAFSLNWALVTQDAHTTLTQPSEALPVSPALVNFLKKTGSPSANNAAANGFNAPTTAALEGTVI